MRRIIAHHRKHGHKTRFVDTRTNVKRRAKKDPSQNRQLSWYCFIVTFRMVCLNEELLDADTFREQLHQFPMRFIERLYEKSEKMFRLERSVVVLLRDYYQNEGKYNEQILFHMRKVALSTINLFYPNKMKNRTTVFMHSHPSEVLRKLNQQLSKKDAKNAKHPMLFKKNNRNRTELDGNDVDDYRDLIARYGISSYLSLFLFDLLARVENDGYENYSYINNVPFRHKISLIVNCGHDFERCYRIYKHIHDGTRGRVRFVSAQKILDLTEFPYAFDGPDFFGLSFHYFLRSRNSMLKIEQG